MSAAVSTTLPAAVPTILEQSDLLTSDHAADLRWYFRVNGMSVFSRSTMAAMLAQAERQSSHARACRKCGGDPKRNVGGCGWAPSNPKRQKPNAAQLALMRWEKSRKRTVPPAADVPCPKCGGTGWVVRGKRRPRGPITARPTGSSINSRAGVSVGDVGIQRLAIVSKRLDWMAARWPMSVDVLDAYYGPDDGEQLIVVWPMTPAGKTLLRRNKLNGLDPLRFLANERDDQAAKRDSKRRALFDAADEQANELLRAARRLWNAAADVARSTAPLARVELEIGDTHEA